MHRGPSAIPPRFLFFGLEALSQMWKWGSQMGRVEGKAAIVLHLKQRRFGRPAPAFQRLREEVVEEEEGERESGRGCETRSHPPRSPMQNAHDPPGYVAPSKWAAAGRPFELPERADPSQDWLTPDGRLRVDLETTRDVIDFEAGATRFAMGQIMSIGQTMFMLWMVGSQLTLWSIMFLLQGGTAPIFALMRLNEGALFLCCPFPTPCVSHATAFLQSRLHPPTLHSHAHAHTHTRTRPPQPSQGLPCRAQSWAWERAFTLQSTLWGAFLWFGSCVGLGCCRSHPRTGSTCCPRSAL